MTAITINLDNLMKSKMKKKSCFDCEIIQSVDNPKCISCINSPNLTDNFKQRPNELDKIFEDAPLMFNTRIETEKPIWESRVYNHIVRHNIGQGCTYRLPTVEEAPKNIWLCPWLTMPIELMELEVLLLAKNGKIKQFHKNKYEPNNIVWKNVIKVMILEN